MNTLHIYLSHLRHNYYYLKSLLRTNVKFVGVVKANAYGCTDSIVANELESLGIDYLAVAFASEGKALRSQGIRCPIMVFYPLFDEIDQIFDYGLEPCVYSHAMLETLSVVARRKSVARYPVHIKFNTGLNRVGFGYERYEEVYQKIPKKLFTIKSVYSHLSSSEDRLPSEVSLSQLKKFESVISFFKNQEEIPFFHILNTSGIFNYPDWHLDMVRSGIGLLGYANNKVWDENLKPIMHLQSKIIQIHTVKKSGYVGYNQGVRVTRDSKIGIVPLGHADGIPRHAGGGKVHVWIGGKPALIVGNICMDLLMVDITDIECKDLSDVNFFGKYQGASVFAEKFGTISYELLSNVGGRVKRIIHP